MPFSEALLGPEEVEAEPISGFDESLLGPEEDPNAARIESLRAQKRAIASGPSEYLADTTLGFLDLPGKVLSGIDRFILPPTMSEEEKASADENTLSSMPPSSRATLEEARDRILLLEHLRRSSSPISTGLRESAVSGIEAMSRPSGVAILGAAVAAPGVMGPALATMGIEGSKDAITRIKESRESGDRPAYYHAIGDLGQVLPMVAGGGAMTARPFFRPRPKPTIPEQALAIEQVSQALEAKQMEQPSMSVGPGAASPAEMAARKESSIRGIPPPNSTPPVVVEAGSSIPTGKPSVVVGSKPNDFTIINRVNSPQFTYWFGKLGEAAKAAWERIALGEFAIREGAGRDIQNYVEGPLQSLPRSLRKHGGKAFFDVLDGQTVEQIRTEWEGKPGGDKVIAASEQVRGRLEEIRTIIRDTKRDSYGSFLIGMDKPTLAELWKKNIGDTVDVSAYTKEQLAYGLSRNQFADDWGIADGSYLPHLFMGQWKVTAKMHGSEATFAFRAKTPAEAQARIFKAAKDNPDLANAQWSIDSDTIIPGDAVRLGDRNFWRLVGEMKDQALEGVNVKEALSGIIGRKSSKQKQFGSLHQRYGFEGYERDYRKVMTSYMNGFHRWHELSAVNRDVQPMIDQVRSEGRPETARQLDDLLDYVWGKPSRTTIEFDNLIRRIPVLTDYIKPLALDRWSRNVRSVASFMTLTTARFAVVNRLQPLQGLLPLLNEGALAKAKVLQHSAEGRAMLDRAGVRFDPGQFSERSIGGRVSGLRERITGERSNQEIAFLAMYEHGISKGMTPEAATKYAKLRGQLMTQFTPLMSDTPVAMRDPVMAAVFQFKRFPIKQVELLTRLAAERNAPGIVRWVAGMAVVGGLNYFFRQLWSHDEKRKRLRDSIAKDHGTTVADTVMYGLPGLVGADISGSMVLGDEPFGSNIYEKVGRSVAGPSVSLVANTVSAVQTASRSPETPVQATADALRRYPTTRPISELYALATGNYDIRSPDGETKHRRKLNEVLLGLGSFRSASESNTRSAIDAAVSLQKESSNLKNALWVKEQSGTSVDSEVKAIADFNSRWPECSITNEEWRNYKAQRKAGAGKTDVERMVGKKYSPLLAPSP